MTKVKLNLASGTVQEREVVTAFNFNGVKYVIFDGESTGSMGLPIILVSKETFGKVVGITDAEEWKNTKECLKKIIAGEPLEYASVPSELKADDVFYRQLTLPIASFDVLKSSYKAPEVKDEPVQTDNSPIFEPISPEEIAGGDIKPIEPVAPSSFVAPEPVSPINPSPVSPIGPQMPSEPAAINPAPAIPEVAPIAPAPIPFEQEEKPAIENNYDELKKEFLAGAEELFNKLYEKFNHKD